MKQKKITTWCRLVLVIIVFMLALSKIVNASELDELKTQMVTMQKQIEKLEKNKKNQFESSSWVNNLNLSGDFRYRHEYIDDSAKDKTRNRQRIRGRLGLKAKINNDWSAIFRITTGSSDSPTSTNQTLDGSFSSKNIWFDTAYVDWHPQSYDGFNAYLGKMKVPFYKVGKNQLIWDGDLTPEGIAISKVFKINDTTNANFTAAE